MTGEKPAEKTEHEIMQWFEHDLLPKIISEGKFPVPGGNPKDLIRKNLEFEETHRGTDHFASVPYFIRLTLEDSKAPSRTKSFPLILKFITQKRIVRTALELDVQFYNEMVFYNEVIPTFEAFLKDRTGVPEGFLSDICPVCRYAHMDLDDPDYGIIILDDLRKDNFASATSKVELDLDYILTGVQKLAKLHAVSYAMKMEKVPEFDKISRLFIECRFQRDNRYKKESLGYFLECSIFRGIDYLLAKSDSEVPETYLKALKDKVKGNAYEIMQNFIIPKEPLAVICHGDFCRNNILFQIEDDRPVDCKLFDYQACRYASPAIDLTFFIYMNSTLELRDKHFSHILETYHKDLVNWVSLISDKTTSDIAQYLPLESILKDFGEHSGYGFIIFSFFLPTMMAPDEVNFQDAGAIFTMTEMAERNAKQGGEVVSERISEVIVDMYRRGYTL